MSLTHLSMLEAEAIHIMREVAASAENPVMLFSVGKDSAVMLHLAKKAFFPAAAFPLLYVDTTWKFRAMYELRDRAAADAGMKLLVHQNPEALKGVLILLIMARFTPICGRPRAQAGAGQVRV